MLVLLYALTTKLNVAHSIIVLAISSLAAFPVIGLSVFPTLRRKKVPKQTYTFYVETPAIFLLIDFKSFN